MKVVHSSSPVFHSSSPVVHSSPPNKDSPGVYSEIASDDYGMQGRVYMTSRVMQNSSISGAETANKKWGGSWFVVQWGVTVHVIGFVRDRCA